MFDVDARTALLTGGKLHSDDGDVTIVFSESKDGVTVADSTSLKSDLEQYAVRGLATIVDSEDKEKGPVETILPVLIVPFRCADSLFFYLTLDHIYIMEQYKLNPEYVFMTRPYAYILKAERKDGGWEVGFVQFATKGLELKKISDRVQTDKDGTVFNPPEEILDMLKDSKNYELSSKLLFLPVK